MIQFNIVLAVAHDSPKPSSQECNIQRDKLHKLLKQCGQGQYQRITQVEPEQNNLKQTNDKSSAVNLQTKCKKDEICQQQKLCDRQYALELHCLGSCWGQCNTPEFKEGKMIYIQDTFYCSTFGYIFCVSSDLVCLFFFLYLPYKNNIFLIYSAEVRKAKCCMEVFSDALKNNSHNGIVQ